MSRHIRSVEPAGCPGRPPALSGAQRRERILDAAEQVFARVGYGAASMEEIARCAGMSKRTLYAFYADRQTLFAAVVDDAEAFPGNPSRAQGISGQSQARAELRARMQALAAFALSPRQLRMTRLLVSEGEHYPELAREFHARVLERGFAYLLEGLQILQREGADFGAYGPNLLANTLFGAAVGDLHLRALLGLSDSALLQQMETRIDMALDLMLPC